ncbi:eukaryotic peptide chain release factor subunit 1-3-like, partial [Homarus americanus]|uniref:eukaryotic peptide chain release factor subunit 1-3-like n=1 Tax=Homarus americanus TaxID=6706 RepID=UPI001C448850
MDRMQVIQFRAALKELENVEALRTSSVLSLHLPSSSSLILVKNRLKDEQSRAANIKSVSNRSSVQEALKSTVDIVSTVNVMPSHGLLVFYGQSVLNKATGERIRLEKRQLLVKKVIALSEQFYLDENKATVQVQALVVGGPGQLKDQLVERLPQLLKGAVRRVENTSYSGRQGLREAINATRDLRQHMLLEKSNTVLSSIFEKLRVDEPDMVCFGDEVRAAMEDGAVQVVVLWDESPEVAWFAENCPEETELLVIPNTTNNTNML